MALQHRARFGTHPADSLNQGAGPGRSMIPEDPVTDGAPSRPEPERPGGSFVTTRWTAVVTAARDSSPATEEALDWLCRAYWYPLYIYLRRCGHDQADAQDLIQSFFGYLIQSRCLAVADPLKGRFRSFLITCLKRFVIDQQRKTQAQKRGGGVRPMSLDDEQAAERYAAEEAEALAPEQAYDRRWALTLLEQAWDRLREECEAAGKLTLFEHLKNSQNPEVVSPSQEELATRLKTTVAAVKSAMFHLRSRYRALLREEVLHTVAGPEEVDEEIRYLLNVVSG